MGGRAPTGVPIEIATNLSAEQAMRKLRAATRKPRGYSIMTHRRIVGTVSRDRVVLRRGTLQSLPESQNYGEFRGRLVDQRGSVKLKGSFVKAGGSVGKFVTALIAALALMTIYFWPQGRDRTMELDGSSLAFVAVFVVFLVVLGWLYLKGGRRRQHFVAEAELLVEDIKRVLN